MRCPYCGGLNTDQASFCTYCGRDLVPSTSSASRQQPQPAPRVSQPPPLSGSRPYGTPPNPQSSPTTLKPPTPSRQAPAAPPPKNAPPTQAKRVDTSSVPTRATSAPEPPAPFPPRTLPQLLSLESGALPYTVVQDTVGDGRKKIVRIAYPPCTAWQQVATLVKALKEFKSDKFDSIIIQGVSEQTAGLYRFTQGQLCLDRNVRLGSQTMDRYLIETGSGYEADSVRIVLSE
jgi:hypothetical protein